MINEIQPNFHDNIGYCSYESCPSYDGKRCELMGFQPYTICEPWVKEMIKDKEEISKYISDNTPLQSDDYTRGYNYAWDECLRMLNIWLDEKEKSKGAHYEDVQRIYDRIWDLKLLEMQYAKEKEKYKK